MNEYKATISVIVRAYNAERYIQDALKSILNQTYKGPIEIIICFDKGSSNKEALEIASKYKKSFENELRKFKIIEHEHMSPFRALLHGFKEANGDYISFLDYDNVYKPEFVETMLSYIRNGKADVAFTIPIITDATLKPLNITFRNPPKKYRISSLLLGGTIMDISGIVIERKSAQLILEKLDRLKHRYFDWIFEDWLIALIVIKEKIRLAYVSDKLYYYRIHELNITASKEPRIEKYKELTNRERELKTLLAFTTLYENELNLKERMMTYAAIIRIVFNMLRLFKAPMFILSTALLVAITRIIYLKVNKVINKYLTRKIV